MEPRIQMRVAGASGDLDSTDRKMNLFRPIATRSPINDLIPVGFANIGVYSVEGGDCTSDWVIMLYAGFLPMTDRIPVM